MGARFIATVEARGHDNDKRRITVEFNEPQAQRSRFVAAGRRLKIRFLL
jgi:hypothetical protein